MKKTLTLLLLVVFAITCQNAQAQFKIHSSGWVSVGSLGTTYGLQVKPSGCSTFRQTSNDDYVNIVISYSRAQQKNWVVSSLSGSSSGTHTFYVLGDGRVHQTGSVRLADASLQQESSQIDSAGYVLDQITGLWYVPIDDDMNTGKKPDRHIGVSAQEVEKVLPEAVTADENGLLYVDYEALTVFLIEAVKEQRNEIETMRKVLEANGLMENPKEP